MDRFPPEILFPIFRNALPHKRENGKVPYSASVSVPLYISHVCRSWRNLSLSYGELWSHLCLELRHHTREGDCKMAVEIFDTWLQRTKQSPINFLFHCYRDETEDAPRHPAMHIITALLEQRRRWKDVNFYWRLLSLSPKFSNIINLNDMRMLTSLVLTCKLRSLHNGALRWTHLAIDISQSPLLEKLDLYGKFVLITGDEPIRTLTGASKLVFKHVERGELAAQSCLNLLKVAPFLTDFRALFEFSGVDASFRLECERPVVLNDLHTLALRDFRGVPAVASISDNLTLPSLRALDYLDYKDDGYVRGGEILLRFIQRSMPPLTFLEIYGRSADEDTLVPVLRLLCGLMDLRIAAATVSTYLFRELTVQDAEEEGSPVSFESVVCPRLVVLHLNRLRLPEDGDTVAEALINMVKSRSQILGTFEYITPDYPISSRFKIPDIPWRTQNLQDCVERGTLAIEGSEVPLFPFSEL